MSSTLCQFIPPESINWMNSVQKNTFSPLLEGANLISVVYLPDIFKKISNYSSRTVSPDIWLVEFTNNVDQFRHPSLAGCNPHFLFCCLHFHLYLQDQTSQSAACAGVHHRYMIWYFVTFVLRSTCFSNYVHNSR